MALPKKLVSKYIFTLLVLRWSNFFFLALLKNSSHEISSFFKFKINPNRQVSKEKNDISEIRNCEKEMLQYWVGDMSSGSEGAS